MPKSVPHSRIKKNIFQFSVFAENKVGCLNVITQAMLGTDVHLLGMSCLDQTDCAVIRFPSPFPARTSAPENRSVASWQWALPSPCRILWSTSRSS